MGARGTGPESRGLGDTFLLRGLEDSGRDRGRDSRPTGTPPVVVDVGTGPDRGKNGLRYL